MTGYGDAGPLRTWKIYLVGRSDRTYTVFLEGLLYITPNGVEEFAAERAANRKTLKYES